MLLYLHPNYLYFFTLPCFSQIFVINICLLWSVVCLFSFWLLNPVHNLMMLPNFKYSLHYKSRNWIYRPAGQLLLTPLPDSLATTLLRLVVKQLSKSLLTWTCVCAASWTSGTLAMESLSSFATPITTLERLVFILFAQSKMSFVSELKQEEREKWWNKHHINIKQTKTEHVS